MEQLAFYSDKKPLENQLDKWDNCVQILRNTTRLAYAEELAVSIQRKKPIYTGWIFSEIHTDVENGQNVYKVLGRRDKLKHRGLVLLRIRR